MKQSIATTLTGTPAGSCRLVVTTWGSGGDFSFSAPLFRLRSWSSCRRDSMTCSADASFA